MRLDAEKPTPPFSGDAQEYVDVWALQMNLYFASNPQITNQQKVIRIALNLAGSAQKWFYNKSRDQDLENISLEGLLQELQSGFQLLNQQQTARKQLRNVRQLISVDVYVQHFCAAYYKCMDVSPQESQERFIENLKPETRLYGKERLPQNLDHAVLLVHSFNTIRYGYPHQKRGRSHYTPRGRGRMPINGGRFNDRYQGNRGRNGGSYRGTHSAFGHGRLSERGRGRQYTPRCYRCGQMGHIALNCPALPRSIGCQQLPGPPKI